MDKYLSNIKKKWEISRILRYILKKIKEKASTHIISKEKGVDVVKGRMTGLKEKLQILAFFYDVFYGEIKHLMEDCTAFQEIMW